jgi:hypothetical protein
MTSVAKATIVLLPAAGSPCPVVGRHRHERSSRIRSITAIRGQTLDAFSGSRPGVLPYVNDVQVSSQTAPVSGFPLGGKFCLNTAVPGAPRMVAGEITYRFE